MSFHGGLGLFYRLMAIAKIHYIYANYPDGKVKGKNSGIYG
ncbi:hypothetical protein [Oculatella sp. FACHB-28]|nr:hypothetical protein [Oculatella sp. FACHB-28]